MIDFLIELLFCLPTVLIALTVHECAHGFIAYKLGDPTAKQMGRLSLNPLRHIDPIGAICMLVFHYGWAKPVPVNSLYFKNPKRGMAFTALAGPVSNLILGFIGVFLYALTLRLLPPFATRNFAFWVAYVWVNLLYYFSWLNISLAIFNLIPIPPLDGSRVLFAFLPERAYFNVMRYERQIALGFMALLLVDSRLLGGRITGGLSVIVEFIFDAFYSLFHLFL